MHRFAILAGAVIVLGAGAFAGTRAVGAMGDDDGSDTPIAGNALEQASAAALAHTGGGAVTETEVGDEEGYYEVEVALADGRQVDVHLDQSFSVLGSESDTDAGGRAD